LTHHRTGCLRNMLRARAVRSSAPMFLCAILVVLDLAFHQAPRAQEVHIAISEPREIIFDSSHDGCEPIDTPDINPRAFRDDKGNVVFFALHFVNRAFRGHDLDHVKLDCHVVLPSHFDPEPAHYDDRSYITSTWTMNGVQVAALVHHEYHADSHSRCTGNTDLACWYNSVLAYLSNDAGFTFTKAKPLVIASAPFGQETEQGRHRGFFNPSNIFSDGTYEYFFAATTGWQGQSAGACLFRSSTPSEPATWRAYDGHAFSVHYADPYKTKPIVQKPCMPISPFLFPVGGVVHDRENDNWIAVFQAARDEGAFPVDGFYYTASRDLLHWDPPQLLLASKTLFSDLCTSAPAVIAYPSILDPQAQGRNFDDINGSAYLYYTVIKVENCAAGERLLVRQRLAVTATGMQQK
jgi:hypothetical protein